MTAKSIINKEILFEDLTAWLPEIFRENSLLLITDVVQLDSKPEWTNGTWKFVFEDQPSNMHPFSKSPNHPQ